MLQDMATGASEQASTRCVVRGSCTRGACIWLCLYVVLGRSIILSYKEDTSSKIQPDRPAFLFEFCIGYRLLFPSTTLRGLGFTTRFELLIGDFI
jgi:hypothetical protein